jgi:hypothetical protein
MLLYFIIWNKGHLNDYIQKGDFHWRLYPSDLHSRLEKLFKSDFQLLMLSCIRCSEPDGYKNFVEWCKVLSELQDSDSSIK